MKWVHVVPYTSNFSRVSVHSQKYGKIIFFGTWSENEARYVDTKTKTANVSRSQPFHDFMKCNPHKISMYAFLKAVFNVQTVYTLNVLTNGCAIAGLDPQCHCNLWLAFLGDLKLHKAPILHHSVLRWTKAHCKLWKILEQHSAMLELKVVYLWTLLSMHTFIHTHTSNLDNCVQVMTMLLVIPTWRKRFKPLYGLYIADISVIVSP